MTDSISFGSVPEVAANPGVRELAVPSKEILWHEARLFALREGKPGAFNVRYELSSPATVVTFSRILRPHR